MIEEPSFRLDTTSGLVEMREYRPAHYFAVKRRSNLNAALIFLDTFPEAQWATNVVFGLEIDVVFEVF